MKKELQRLKEGPKVKIHLDLFRATLKKVPNWKMPGYDGIHGSWFKKYTSLYEWLAIKMNRCREETCIPEWMTKTKTFIIQKDPQKEQPPITIDP